jgi:hypothetical protein
MDKKNTMLLTVIAVATLLVAVVGATFAYFSVAATGQNTATNVAVHGLGTAAYTASTAYAAANHTHQWTYDSSTETLTFGSAI